MSNRSGFSFVEAITSVAIIGLIATISIVNLTASRRVDELNTAARVLAGDLRSMQSRALSAQNIKSCTVAGGTFRVCENNTTSCVGACTAMPPWGIGASFSITNPGYTWFVENEVNTLSWTYSGVAEFLQLREFAKSGAQNVVIDALSTLTPASVAFERQNGGMVINGCQISKGCMTTTSLSITLRHTVSNVTKIVSMDSITGKISIQ